VILVVNSGPLISLARIGRLEILPALFAEVVCPRAVFDEVTLDRELPGAEAIAAAEWLNVVTVSDRAAVEHWSVWLDSGESEVLVLAQELGATVAIDERRARRLAADLSVPQTGTVGILLTAKRQGLIAEVSPLLDQLSEQGIRLSPRLREEARRLAGET
jgi:predicted nucleic acid-binding protein